MPKISVIVPVYNAARFLERCLDSILAQTMRDYEVICVNDGSTDDSPAILEAYRAKHEQIKCITQKNGGAAAARNAGLAHAAGEYIVFVDADDRLMPQFLEKLLDSAEKSRSDVAVCAFQRVYAENGKVVSTEMTGFGAPCRPADFIDDTAVFINTAPWNKLIRRKLLEHIRFENVKVEDLLFSIELLLNAERVSFVPQPLYCYISHGGSEVTSLSYDDLKTLAERLYSLRESYRQKFDDAKRFLDVFDYIAFIHLGISLIFRLSYNSDCRLQDAIRYSRQTLDTFFSRWRKTEFLKFGYIVRHFSIRRLTLKALRLMYRIGGFIVFIRLYRFMTDRLNIDVKW